MLCFSFVPLCQDIPTQHQINLQKKATRKLIFQVRIYLGGTLPKEEVRSKTKPSNTVD